MYRWTTCQVLQLLFKHEVSNRPRTRNLCFSVALIAALAVCAFGRDVALFRTVLRTEMASGGVGQMRNTGTGTITISGITTGSTINAAYLYWHGPTNSLDPNVNANVLVNGNAVTGNNIGFSSDNNWGYMNSQAYRADITSLVTGNGNYVLTGFGFANNTVAGGATTNGASIIVFYTDGVTANYRDVALMDGNDSNAPNPYDAPGWTATVSGINYLGTATANLWLHVSDGQAFLDDALVINGMTSTPLVPAGPIFQGDSVGPFPPDPVRLGNLWDIKSFNITSFLTQGMNTLTLTTGVNHDYLSLIAGAYDLPAGTITIVPGLTLSPATGTNTVGQTHTVTALATLNGNSVGAGTTVSFNVNGANTTSGSCTTDGTGTCPFTYTGTNLGNDLISAKATISGTPVNATPVSETWVSPATATLTLSPASATNVVGQTHTVTASATSNGAPAPNVNVNFLVSGANSVAAACTTGTNGTCPFAYTGFFAGTDLITATATVGQQSLQATANKIWLPSESRTLHFSPGATSTQTAVFLSNNSVTDPASHAMAFTTNVKNPFDVTLTASYVPTELTPTGTAPTALTALAATPLPGVANGICEAGGSVAPTDSNIDCRLAAGGFVFKTLTNGDQVVSHCSAYHNTMCTWYRASTTAKALDEVPTGSPVCGPGVLPPCYDYIGPVQYEIGYNTNVVLANPSPSPAWPSGWNNKNGRLYDRRGDDPQNFFKFDVTSFYDINGNVQAVLAGDQTVGGGGRHYNDWVVADVPNPEQGNGDVVELVVPAPRISPFPYLSGIPMLVSVELEKVGTETSDPTGLDGKNTVNVSTFDANGKRIEPKTFPGFPTTFKYDPFFKVYYIFLSPAPYKADGTTVYTMQIGGTLFPQPVTAKFVVKQFR